MRATVVSLVVCLSSWTAWAVEPAEAPLRSHSAWRGGPADFAGTAPRRVVRSALAPDVIQRVIGLNRASVRSCLAYAVRFRPDALGNATIAVRTDGAGRVADVRVVRASDGRFGRCVEGVVRRWRFPVRSASSGVLKFF